MVYFSYLRCPLFLMLFFFSFRAEGEFWTHSPVPQIRFHLKAISKGFMHDDKLIAKVNEIISLKFCYLETS